MEPGGPYQGELTHELLAPDQRDACLVWRFGGKEYEVAKAICIPFSFDRTQLDPGVKDIKTEGNVNKQRQGFLLIGFVGSGHQ
jgi:hypothetical protein